MPNPILDAARARLSAIAADRAALDVEERELRAMVAAADGAKAQPAPVAPFISPVFTWPARQCSHNGACGCGCNGWVHCATGTLTIDAMRAGDVRYAAWSSAQMPAVYVEPTVSVLSRN